MAVGTRTQRWLWGRGERSSDSDSASDKPLHLAEAWFPHLWHVCAEGGVVRSENTSVTGQGERVALAVAGDQVLESPTM